MLEVIRHLRRGPDGEASELSGLRVEFEARQSRVRLHGRVRDFVGDEAGFFDVVGLGKALLRITENVVVVLFDVVRLVVVDQVALDRH